MFEILQVVNFSHPPFIKMCQVYEMRVGLQIDDDHDINIHAAHVLLTLWHIIRNLISTHTKKRVRLIS